MATKIYLGEPPQYMIDWIKAHSKPAVGPKTKITFTDGTSQEYDWKGVCDIVSMIEAGLFDEDEYTWIKKPQTVEIGSNVTSIGSSAFSGCCCLTSVTIPSSVTSIWHDAFSGCGSLMSVTFSGKDKVTVQGMAGYSWKLTSGCVIHCTDGDITL